MLTALVTGINGQDGSYLAELLLEKGYRVVGYVRDSASTSAVVPGLHVVQGVLDDERRLREVIETFAPQEIYNLAARASSAHLFADPIRTAEINGLAVAKMLEVIRTTDPRIRFCQASSSEMFGHVSDAPQSERTPFRPRNPYGVAKLFAHGMVGTYRDSFGVFACSAILYNHESPRRSDHFVTRKITLAVARIQSGLQDRLYLGNLNAQRDWGFARDYTAAMWRMLQVSAPDDYVIATGESHSVREFCEIAFSHVGLDYRNFVSGDSDNSRREEPVPLVGDATKARTVLGWQPTQSFDRLVRTMVEADVAWITSQRGVIPSGV